jgi:hypothetical protein
MSEWHTLLIDGHERATRAFLSGFAGDRGVDPTGLLMGEDVGLHPESLGERLLELLGAGRHQLVLVVEEHVAALADALERAGAAVGLRLAERHRVAGARFDFAVETFSREVAARVRAALRPQPAGVTFVTHDVQEEHHPDAKGVELYAPEHAYAFRARARVTGTLDAILTLRRMLAAIEAVRIDGLHLDLA